MSEVRIQSIDQLGLVKGMIEELEIMEQIDAMLPSLSEDKKVSCSIAVAAMILNGLGYANKQLYLTPRFFEKKATEHLLGEGITPEMLNRDTLGRTLDALFEYGVSECYERIARHAMKKLGLMPSLVHLDSTSFHVDGTYNSRESPVEGVVHITPGYSRDHHPELNQVVLNLIVDHQSGIPLMMKAANGNQIDTKAFATLVEAHIDALKTATDTSLTLIADAALYTQKGLRAIGEKEIRFISRVPRRLKEAKILESETVSMEPLDDSYRFHVGKITYGGMAQQWVLYESAHGKKRASESADKAMFKESLSSAKAAQKLQRQTFYCEADAKEALEAFRKAHDTIELQELQLVQTAHYNGRGRPARESIPSQYRYQWQLSPSMALNRRDEDREQEGRFILATNDLSLSPQELLGHYKAQQRVERGFRFLKSPEFLSDALFLKKPERIEAMLMIMTLCLMVYASLEYKIRKELKEQDKTFPNQLGKPVQNPTARWIFECFHEIQMVYIAALKQCMIANLLDRNRIILDLLGSSYWRYYQPNLKLFDRGAQ